MCRILHAWTRSLSDIASSTAANDTQASALFSAREKSSTYSSEYASGFSGPAASHLPAPPSPRDEQQCRTGSNSTAICRPGRSPVRRLQRFVRRLLFDPRWLLPLQGFQGIDDDSLVPALHS